MKIQVSKNTYNKIPGVMKNLLPIVFTDLPKTNANKYTTIYHLPRVRQDISTWREAMTEMEMPYVPHRVKSQILFRDTILNGHVKACMSKRKNLTLLKEFAIVGPDGTINEKCTNLFKKQWFDLLVNYILDAQFFSYSLINWTSINNNNLEGLQIIRRDFVSPDRNLLQPYPYTLTGKSLDDKDIANWILYVKTASVHGISPAGYGLLYEVALYEIILRNLIGQNATYVELFGQPIREGKTDKAQDSEERAILETALADMGSSGWILHDTQDEINLIQNNMTGSSSQAYADLEKRCEAKISKLILGHSDALDSTPGKLGSAQGEKSPVQVALEEVQVIDNKLVEYVVNDQFIPILNRLGFGIPTDHRYTYLNNQEKKDIISAENKTNKEVADYILGLSNAGYEVDPDWIKERINIPIKKKPMATGLLGGGGMGES